jgi:hypothetical protein
VKYLCVTIDVEPDCSPSWRYSDPLTFDGVRKGITDRLQPLFGALGVRPTYLLNNVVLEDSESLAALAALGGGAEFGAHLHPEFIEPEKRYGSYGGVKAEANLCSLGPDLEFRKIERITRLFQDRLGVTPRSFRAGRFSAGTHTIRSLERLGYLVDSSVTPGVLWDDPSREIPVDFRGAPPYPYRVGETILDEDPRGSVLEVPVSICVIRRWFRPRLLWLRPKLSSSRELRAVARACADAQQHRSMQVLNMMFHNVEILPGLSPYTRTEGECREYLNTLRAFLIFALREGFASVTLSELYERCSDRR